MSLQSCVLLMMEVKESWLFWENLTESSKRSLLDHRMFRLWDDLFNWFQRHQFKQFCLVLWILLMAKVKLIDLTFLLILTVQLSSKIWSHMQFSETTIDPTLESILSTENQISTSALKIRTLKILKLTSFLFANTLTIFLAQIVSPHQTILSHQLFNKKLSQIALHLKWQLSIDSSQKQNAITTAQSNDLDNNAYHALNTCNLSMKFYQEILPGTTLKTAFAKWFLLHRTVL